ncbi:cupin domain-containing protein [Mitsuaria sp. 7]|uniref:cupin domain-containing protein n=1 Tax=Mitsuaria sp. 7 TaxID=1658665 RepID=UPI0007DCD70E|nr:cupin domain-containing protein [Mitsuaria sp. 7]ANH67442.1 transcriptional regulator [Mitsuaria sp. 7]
MCITVKPWSDPVEPSRYRLPPEKLIEGDPLQTLWVHHVDARQRFSAGYWHSEVGKWHVAYTEEEFCEILEGVSLLTDAQGHTSTLRAGDRFVIPRGFRGCWEVIEPTRKLFVAYEDEA